MNRSKAPLQHIGLLLGAIVALSTLAVLGQDGSHDFQSRAESLSPQGHGIFGLMFDGNQFIALGADQTVWTSPDGGHWSQQQNTMTPYRYLDYAVCGNGRVLMGVGQGYSTFLTADLRHWEEPRLVRFFDTISFAGHYFFALGGFGYIYISIDALHWWGVASPVRGGYLNSVGYDESTGRYVASYGWGKIAISQDALNWQWLDVPATAGVTRVVCGMGRIVAVPEWFQRGPQALLERRGEGMVSWVRDILDQREEAPGSRIGERFVMVGPNFSSL